MYFKYKGYYIRPSTLDPERLYIYIKTVPWNDGIYKGKATTLKEATETIDKWLGETP